MTTLRHTANSHQHDLSVPNINNNNINNINSIRASPSSEMLSSDAYSEEINPNVEFFSGKGFWSFYIIFLLTARVLIGLIIHTLYPSGRYDCYITTVVNSGHTIVTFVIIHWVKGTPFWIPSSQGRYDRDTFWEQIDDGRQYTQTRKILTLIPVALFLLASYDTNYTIIPLLINLTALGFAVVPKLAALDHVRIFGINKD